MKTLKFLFKYLFTINDKKESKPLSIKEHLLYRFILLIIVIPLTYILLFSYFDDGFNIINLLKTFLFILFFRFFAKDFTDSIISFLFFKSSYKIHKLTLKQKRLKKLKRINENW